MNIRNLTFIVLVMVLKFGFAQDQGYIDMTVNEFKKVVEHPHNTAVILDLRTENEFAESFIKGAKNMNALSPNFQTQLQTLDKNKTYYVYCFSGGRSARAAKQMSDLGFKNVFNITGGIRDWTQAGNAVEK